MKVVKLIASQRNIPPKTKMFDKVLKEIISCDQKIRVSDYIETT